MTREFAPKLAPLSEPRLGKPINIVTFFLKALLAQRHKFFLVAALQLGITILFPSRFAIVPLATLGLTVLTTFIIDKFTPAPPLPPAHLRSVVQGRTTALLPHRDGSFGPTPSNHSLVVFHLGVQFNHPQGQMSPYAKDIAEKLLEMNRNLLSRRDELGLLSITAWTGSGLQDESSVGSDTMKVSYYFKNVESIHQFAHEEMHRGAWDWYHAVKPHHIGIFHETFQVPAHGHETIYVNCRPMLLGAGSVKTEEKGEMRWRNLLLSSDHVALKGQWERLNRDANGVPKE